MVRKKKKEKVVGPSISELKKKLSNLPWLKCLKNNTSEKRKLFCKANYKNIRKLFNKCETSYCNVCCDKYVPWTHRNQLHTCKKQCNRLVSVASSPKQLSEINWKNLCISVTHPNNSIYAYCENNFKEMTKISECKVDTCRLCCVSTDEIKFTNVAPSSLNECFQKCAETFIPVPDFEF